MYIDFQAQKLATLTSYAFDLCNFLNVTDKAWTFKDVTIEELELIYATFKECVQIERRIDSNVYNNVKEITLTKNIKKRDALRAKHKDAIELALLKYETKTEKQLDAAHLTDAAKQAQFELDAYEADASDYTYSVSDYHAKQLRRRVIELNSVVVDPCQSSIEDELTYASHEVEIQFEDLYGDDDRLTMRATATHMFYFDSTQERSFMRAIDSNRIEIYQFNTCVL